MIENVIIMAGGAGKRLWPASMGQTPKQFLKIYKEQSLFLTTLERAFNLDIQGSIYIVINENYVKTGLEECASLIRQRKRISILAEPVAKIPVPR